MPRGIPKAKAAAAPLPVLTGHHKIVVDILMEQMGLDQGEITLDSTPEDLHMDSLDFVELVMELEERLKIDLDDEELSKLKTVGEMVQALDLLTQPPAR